MKGHFSDVRKWYTQCMHTNSFAKHFVRHFSEKPSASQVREICKFEILRTINPFSFMRGIRTYKCRLCVEEKIEMISARKANPRNLMNENRDIYGPLQARNEVFTAISLFRVFINNFCI